jgi:hypothetical protein
MSRSMLNALANRLAEGAELSGAAFASPLLSQLLFV